MMCGDGMRVVEGTKAREGVRAAEWIGVGRE